MNTNEPEHAPAKLVALTCPDCGARIDLRTQCALPAPTPPADAHDWTEDAAHENGRYQNKCANCGTVFIGHKRRVWCKVCAQGCATSSPPADAPTRPRVTQHWGDCTYYASLVNRNPTDGICTCGYGWTVFADSGGTNYSQLYSDERRAHMDGRRGPDPVQPPADAPEPPWVELLARITNYLGNGGLFNPEHMEHDKVRDLIMDCRTALQHAAALAQERDALRVEYESRALWIAEMNRILGYDNSDGFHSEPDPHTIARALVSERETLRATVARLTAERDRYHAALLGVANHVYVTGQSCWCNAWEDNPEHYRAEQHHAYCTVALALSGAPCAP